MVASPALATAGVYTADCDYFVPSGTTGVAAVLIGGQGGAGNGGLGGNAGQVSGVINTAGVVSIEVGIGNSGYASTDSNPGSAGSNIALTSLTAGNGGNGLAGGGGGGGAGTGLRDLGTGSYLMIAGGGGGGAIGNTGGAGGGSAEGPGDGSAGGGAQGSNTGAGGGGAQQNGTPGTGGAAATSGGTNGIVGDASGLGGDAGEAVSETGGHGGGGGGGGYSGGGGGGAGVNGAAAGAGGGGSGYVDSGLVSSEVFSTTASAPQVTLTPDSAPSPPADVAAALSGSTSATITWSAGGPFCGNVPVSSYEVQRSSGGSWTSLPGPASSPYTATGLSPGSTYSFRVTATNGNGTGPASDSASVVVPGLASQTITFPAIADIDLSAGFAALSATASSGLDVTYASQTTSICKVSGATAVLLAAGTCTITASQVGNGTYDPAPDVSNSFTVRSSTSQPQVPVGSCANLALPKRVKPDGDTALIPRGGCVTNAGQVVRVSASATFRSASARGDVIWYRLIRKANRKVLIRTYGHRIGLTIRLGAKATGTYGAYSVVRRYRLA